jgi:hypothetical protein
MPVDRSHIQENGVQLQRLRTLVGSLSDTELRRPLDAGWTVAGVLGHLAFWDQRTVLLIERWQRDGTLTPPTGMDEATVDWINDAAKPMLLAVPPREMATLALRIADETDRKVAELPDAFAAANTAAGSPVYVLRAAHRAEHLDQIERAISRRGA